MRMLIVEDHPLARLGTRMVAQEMWGKATIDEAAHLSQALQYAAAYRYDLITMDPGLPDIACRKAAIAQLAALCPSAPLVVISGSDHPKARAEALEAGARAFLSRAMSLQEFHDALTVLTSSSGESNNSRLGRVARDQLEAPGRVAYEGPSATANDTNRYENFSPRHRDILPLLSSGRTNKEIAAAFGLADNTVKQHVRAIMRRIDS